MPVKSNKNNKYPKDNFTGEVFTFHVEPQRSSNPKYIIDTPNFKMFTSSGKAYIYDNAEIEQIDLGAFNNCIELIRGLSDESAADKIKTMFRTGQIKLIKSQYDTIRRHRFHPKSKNKTNAKGNRV